jgi:hypothetical protein
MSILGYLASVFFSPAEFRNLRNCRRSSTGIKDPRNLLASVVKSCSSLTLRLSSPACAVCVIPLLKLIRRSGVVACVQVLEQCAPPRDYQTLKTNKILRISNIVPLLVPHPKLAFTLRFSAHLLAFGDHIRHSCNRRICNQCHRCHTARRPLCRSKRQEPPHCTTCCVTRRSAVDSSNGLGLMHVSSPSEITMLGAVMPNLHPARN